MLPLFMQNVRCYRHQLRLSSTISHTSSTMKSYDEKDLHTLIQFFEDTKGGLVCLTGAGVSTESNIPDYRSPNGSYSRGHKPMVHQEFVSERTDYHRKRYWARSLLGFKFFNNAKPNSAHLALSCLESKRYVNGIITQNVDRLHQKAGSSKVVDLHGRNDKVQCINPNCNLEISRRIIQKQIEEMNPTVTKKLKEYELSLDEGSELRRADGDANVEGLVDYNTFAICNCPRCGGILKPKVVFFGDNVPPRIVQESFSMIDNASGLLVVGTSLEVYSAFRFVNRANDLKIPIIILNKGPTRAERHSINIFYKTEANCAHILEDVINTIL